MEKTTLDIENNKLRHLLYLNSVTSEVIKDNVDISRVQAACRALSARVGRETVIGIISKYGGRKSTKLDALKRKKLVKVYKEVQHRSAWHQVFNRQP